MLRYHARSAWDWTRLKGLASRVAGMDGPRMASRSQGGQQPKAGFPNSELGRDGKTSQQADGVERDMSRALALTAIALAVLLFSGTAVESRGQTSCSFKAGFKTLRDQIPQVVGDCLEDE